jgi:SAM-dependent methyltransferase
MDKAALNRGIGTQSYYERYYKLRNWTFYSGILGQIVSYSQPGSILDVGAGTGLLVEAARKWGFDCEGIDGSEAAVEVGQRRVPGLRLRHHFLSDPFPFAHSTFQTVLLNQVIEHLEPEVARNALLESARVLRKGGMILIHSPSRFNRSEVAGDPTHIHAYTPSELRAIVASSGFQTIVSMDSPINWLGSSRIGLGMMLAALKFTGWDCFSASANCRAYRS